jgi:cobalt-zinc-cadmium efflux system outer membrane protein
VKQTHLFLIIPLLFSLSGCRWKKIKPTAEYAAVKNEAADALQTNNRHYDATLHTHALFADRLHAGLTRNDALDYALANNIVLQSNFEKLGISKAGVAQASLYSNPTFYIDSQLPTTGRDVQFCPNRAIIDVVFTWNFLELFFMPLRREVAEDELRIAMHESVKSVLDMYAQTQKAYTACVVTKKLHELTQKVTDETEHIHKNIVAERTKKNEDESEAHEAYVSHMTWQVELLQAETAVKNAHITLRTLFSIDPTEAAIACNEPITFTLPSMPSLSFLEEYALQHHPDIKIARENVKKAHDSLAVEQRLFPAINVGFALARNFSQGPDAGPRVFAGPAITADIPLFNNNSGNIARAHFQISKADKEYKAVKQALLANIRKAYNTFVLSAQTVKTIKNVMDLHQKVSDAHKEMTSTAARKKRIQLYEAQKKMLTVYQEALNALTDLEVAVGKRLQTLNEAANTTHS